MKRAPWLMALLFTVACSSSSSTEGLGDNSTSQGGSSAAGKGGEASGGKASGGGGGGGSKTEAGSGGSDAGSGGSAAGDGGASGSTSGAAGSGGSAGAGQGGASGGTAGATGAGGAGQGGVGGAEGVGGSGGAAAGGAGGAGGAGAGGAAAGGGGEAGAAGDGGGAGSAGGPAVVRFIALGDAGEANTGQKQVAAAMVKKCAESGCDFAILLGDNFYDDGVQSVDDPQWKTKFEDIYKDLDIPFYAVLGNHDYGGDGAGYEVKNADVQVAYAKISTKWKMPSKHYHFTAGDAEFFALDTNEQMYMAAGDQKKTMAGWISQSMATWKIALGHHPILSNGPHGNAGTYEGIPFVPIVSGGGVKDFMDDVICGKVDLYLCGHDHSRQFLKDTCKGTELVVSGAGAKTSKLNQKNPYHFQALTTGFFYVRIEGNTLTSEFVDEAGQVEFTRVLTKLGVPLPWLTHGSASSRRPPKETPIMQPSSSLQQSILPEASPSESSGVVPCTSAEARALKGLIARQMNRGGNTLLCGLEPLSSDEFFANTAGGISAAWTVGHIACVNDLFSSWFSGEQVIDEETHRIFNNLALLPPTGESKASSVDPARYPKQTLLYLLRQGQTKALRALDAFDTARWDAPPPPCAPDTLQSCGAVWEHLSVHTYWHLGELTGLLSRFHGTYTLNTLPHYFYYPRT